MSKGCDFCEVIEKKYIEKYIELEGGWILSHWSNEKEKYLGRLVMATKHHRRNWNDLSLLEATNLGINIQRINGCLRQYWLGVFPNDSIEQVYAVYFNDAPYKTEKPNPEQVDMKLHVHMHILPRTREMRKSLRGKYKNLGWKLVDFIDCFPDKYQVSGIDNPKVKDLMNYLRKSLKTGSSQ